LGVAGTHAVGRGLEQVVQRVAETGRRGHLLRPRGGGYAISRQPSLEILRAACGTASLGQAQDDQEHSGGGDDREDHRYRKGWHLFLQKGQYSLSGGG